MNFSQAVKGRCTNSGKQQSIQSAAQTELGRNLTKEEMGSLSSRFSLDELFVNLHKVTWCTNNGNFTFTICFPVWIWIPEISTVPVTEPKAKLFLLSNPYPKRWQLFNSWYALR